MTYIQIRYLNDIFENYKKGKISLVEFKNIVEQLNHSLDTLNMEIKDREGKTVHMF